MLSLLKMAYSEHFTEEPVGTLEEIIIAAYRRAPDGIKQSVLKLIDLK